MRRERGSNSRVGVIRPNGLANRPLHHLGIPPYFKDYPTLFRTE